MEYIISDIQSLQKIRQEKTMRNSIRRIKISNVELAGRYEQKLNKYYFTCGCKEGSMAVSGSLFLFLLMWAISGFEFLIPWWQIAAILFASALTGKILGLLIINLD